MGEAFPLCDSPRGMLFHTWEVSSQKVRQSSDAVVLFFKKLRLAHQPREEVLAENDVCWFVLSIIPCFCFVDACYNSFVVGPNFSKKSVAVLNWIVTLSFFVTHYAVINYIIYWHRDMPFRIIGAKMRFMVEVIPMIAAAALHHLLEFNWAYIEVLIGCTTYFYFIGHFMNAAYDIGLMDVLLGSAMPTVVYIGLMDALLGSGMPTLVYIGKRKSLVSALTVCFCLVLSLCRFIIYRAPDIPPHRKKDLKRLPC